MTPILVLSLNTFREIIRDRILYGILVFALFLIGLSLALGQLSFAEQVRISTDFGFTGIHISAAILAIFIGSSLVAKEIDKRTIMTLLVRPLSRTQFIFGKFLGLSLLLSVLVIGLAVVLALVVNQLGFVIQFNFVVAVFGIWLESLVLLSLALFFGSFSRPIMTVIFAASFFLLGHWVDSLKFFMTKNTSASFKMLGKVISNIVPNLETLNWRAAPVYSIPVEPKVIAQAIAYNATWIVFLLLATALIFRRRDFV
jgi:ABC-type transport system involved in multi-copper enzyme maturation permease subunit